MAFATQPDLSGLISISKNLTPEQQLTYLATLSGAHTPSTTQKNISLALSAAIKITFFASYLAQTLNGNPNALIWAWTGGLISGGLNAVLGGSLDSLIKRLTKATKSLTDGDAENIKENLFSLALLLPTALYLGYAQAGPFGEGTQDALSKLLGLAADKLPSQILTQLTVVTEGLFLTHSALELFENTAHRFFPDKWSVSLIRDSKNPLQTAQAVIRDGPAPHSKSLSKARIAKTSAAFSFHISAYASTMAGSTRDYLKGNPLYTWLPACGNIARVPIGAALLNLPACYNYTRFLLGGVETLTDPWVRLGGTLFYGKAFFDKKTGPFFPEKEWGHDIESRDKALYFSKYLFTLLGAYLAYSSSVERAKAGTHESSAYLDFCQNILLVIMAFTVNAWALGQLPSFCFDILQACCTRSAAETKTIDINSDFDSSDFRQLKRNLAKTDIESKGCNGCCFTWRLHHDQNPEEAPLIGVVSSTPTEWPDHLPQ